MPRRAKVRYVSLKSCLVNLPISIYGPLVEHQVRPQSLAIHLTSLKQSSNGKTLTAYVGWTGMAASSSLAAWNSGGVQGSEAHLETIEMDPQYAQAIGFLEHETLEIGLLHDLPPAKVVHTEPLTADDWEILELHAEYVENNLLSQVRVAAVGQEVDVWVLGRTRIRFQVVSFAPTGSAALLSTDTEVVIAPKARSTHHKNGPIKKTAGLSAPPLDVTLQPDTSSEDQSFKKSLTLRILPSKYFGLQSPMSELDESQTTVWVSPDSFSRFTKSKRNEVIEQKSRYVRVRRLKPPQSDAPDGGDADGLPNPAGPSSPSPKVLRGAAPKADITPDMPSFPELTSHCLLRCTDRIPNRHCVLVLGMRGEFDGAENWDLVSICLVDAKDLPSVAPPTAYIKSHVTPAPASSDQHTLAGVDAILKQAHEYVVNALAVQALDQTGPPTSCHHRAPALLICGAPGSGRTSIAKHIARTLETDPRAYSYVVYADLAKHSEDRVPTLRNKFQSWLDAASWHSPSILVLDNLDRVAGPEVEHADSFRSRHIAELFLSVFTPPRPSPGVVLLATCQGQHALHPLLSSAHVFSTRLTLKAPDKDARKDILARIVGERTSISDIRQNSSHPLNFTALATETDGYSATDLRDLVGRAMHEAALRSSKSSLREPTILVEDFAAAQVDFTPLSLRDVKLQKSEVRWSDIGGLHETRRILRETLEWPTKYGAIFAKCPLRLRSGLLLYGYPGCGKTLLASAVAKECGLNFISVKGPELLNKYIGASEKSVRDIFDRASAAKPCVLFFDEFDSIAPKRGHDSTGVTDRVVNQMLTQMDGAEGLDGVYVLAATSRPDLIDPALLRPGRLDKSLLCGMPDEQERLEILQAFSHKITLADQVDLSSIARQTEGYSGADLQALVYNAHLEVVHETIAAQEERLPTVNGQVEDEEKVEFTTFGGGVGRAVVSKADEGVLKRRLETMLSAHRRPAVSSEAHAEGLKHVVQESHLRRSLASTRPSVSEEEYRRLRKTYQAFVSERSGQLPVPSEDVTVGSRQSLG